MLYDGPCNGERQMLHDRQEMRLLQLNHNYCKVAQDLLPQTMAEKQSDVASVVFL